MDDSKLEYLTIDQVERFKATGILVVPAVLTQEEVKSTREDFHRYLKDVCEVDIDNLKSTYQNLDKYQKYCSGGICNLFYTPFKFEVMQNENVHAAMS